MAGMAWNSTGINDPRDIVGNAYGLTFDAASCRRIVVASCRGRFGEVPLSVVPLMRSTLKGRLGEAMVVMAGYDDASITSAVDQVMAEADAQGVVRVLWLTYRTSTSYVLPGGLAANTLYASHNSELAAAAQRHTNLQILDWDKFTANQSTWFAADGIHLSIDGSTGLATFIKNALDAQTAIGRCRATSALTGVPDGGAIQPTPPSTAAAGFVPIAPKRVLDTREPTLGGAAGKLGTGRTVSIDVSQVVPDRRGRHGAQRDCNRQLLRRFPHRVRLREPATHLERELRGRSHDSRSGHHPDDRWQGVHLCLGGNRHRRRRDGSLHPRRRPFPPDDTDAMDRHPWSRGAVGADHRVCELRRCRHS